MARIHVLWDPKSAIQPLSKDVAERSYVKYAILDVADDCSNETLARLSTSLVSMLLSQVLEEPQ